MRTLYRERRLPEAADLYRELVEREPVDPEVHLLGARLYRLQGDLWAALRAIDEARARCPQGSILGQVLFTRGCILTVLSASNEAIEQFDEVLGRFPEYSDLGSELLGPVWFNLGLALRQAKRYPEALNAYETAAGHFRQAGMESFLCMSLHNLAWAACLQGEVSLAAAALDEAEPLCKNDLLHWHQTLGRAHLEAVTPGGDRGRVTEGCMALMDRQTELPPDVMSHACWLAGRMALELQLYDNAMVMADLAVHHAVRAKGENRTLHDASDLRRAVACAMGLLPGATGS